MGDYPYSINSDDFEDEEYELFLDIPENPPHMGPSPREDYDLDEILEYHGTKEGPMNGSDSCGDEYGIYSFLVLAYHAIDTQDLDYLPAIHVSLRMYDIMTFALSSLGVNILAELVNMGLKIPDSADVALDEKLSDNFGDTFNDLFPEDEMGEFKWYKTWGTMQIESFEEYPLFDANNPGESDMVILQHIYNLVQDRLSANFQ